MEAMEINPAPIKQFYSSDKREYTVILPDDRAYTARRVARCTYEITRDQDGAILGRCRQDGIFGDGRWRMLPLCAPTAPSYQQIGQLIAAIEQAA